MCFVHEETQNTVINRKQSPIDITVLRCALCVRKHRIQSPIDITVLRCALCVRKHRIQSSIENSHQ